MRNTEISSSPPPGSNLAKTPSDSVVSPPTPSIDVESPNSLASDVQDDTMEEDCPETRSESENKVQLFSDLDLDLGGGTRIGFGYEDSSLENNTEQVGDFNVARMETEANRDFVVIAEKCDNIELDNCKNSVINVVNCSSDRSTHINSSSILPRKLDVFTPEQLMEESELVKIGSDKKRKTQNKSKQAFWFENEPNRRVTRSSRDPNRRLTRSNSKPNNGQKSHVEYLGVSHVDILGLERSLKRLSRSGSKRVIQELAHSDHSLEKCLEMEKSDHVKLCKQSGNPSSDLIREETNKEKAEVFCPGISMQEEAAMIESTPDTGHGDATMSECKMEETKMPLSDNQAVPMETPQILMDESSKLDKMEKSGAEKSSKRKTRSNNNVQSTCTNELAAPSRRFTRSLLKTDNTPEPNYVEESNGEDEDLSGLGRRPARRFKSSGKIPVNSKDLLATGLLDGFTVMYVIPHSKKPVLKGEIKSGNILCFCSTCNGSRTVSANNFEIHAGSTKKHPSDFIFLENGNTFRDVLKACFSATVETLEATILNALGPASTKNIHACLRCGYALSENVHKFLLCDSCSLPNQTFDSPGPTRGASAIDRPAVPATLESIAKPSKNVSSCSSIKKMSSAGRITRKHVGLHKLVFMNNILLEGTEVAYFVGGKRLLDGYIKDGAIFCHCCSAVVSPSQFEAHAGQSSRRKPYNNIYTSNGVSLHELSVSLSKEKVVSIGETDDLCSICSDGGDLIVCDVCPRAFHRDCVGLEGAAEGDWYCQFCVNLHRRDNCLANNDNARAAGRVDGADPIEEIFKRCIRMVSISEKDLGGCAFCKETDFSKSGFDNRTVILCDQCQREYHVGCLRDHDMADLKELPEGEWFCCTDCSTLHCSLKELILSGPKSLTSADLDLIRAKHESKARLDHQNENENKVVDYDNIRWRLLSGSGAEEEEVTQLLSGAVDIFHESFDPIIDVKSKQDLIPAMVHGMSIEGHQDYSGMYCAVLTSGSEVVSAGLLRLFGSDAAELPLVATSRNLQGLGYFQGLFACMETMLKELNVKHFVLPAAEEAESIWTNKFGFKRICSNQVEEYLKGAHITAFSGTSTLHKPLLS